MSTKIWEAFRVERGHSLEEVVSSIRTDSEKRVRDAMRSWMKRLIQQSADPKNAAEAVAYLTNNKICSEAMALHFMGKWDVIRAFDYLHLCYLHQLKSMESSVFDLDVTVTFRIRNGRIYVIPYRHNFLGQKCLRLDMNPMLEDYHYQDQSDPPSTDEVSAAQWRQRKRVWTEMLDDPNGGWRDVLVLQVLAPHNMHSVIMTPGMYKLKG